MTLKSTLVIAALCLTSVAALAQTPPAAAPAPAAAATPATAPSPEQAKRFEACKADVAKFCATEATANVKGEIGKCLKAHTAELSDGCKTARAAREAERAAEKAKPAQ